MVATRSKSGKKVDRKQKVWGALRIADKVMAAVKNIAENEDLDINKLDMSELSLIMTALPLPPEDRKLLIDNVVVTA